MPTIGVFAAIFDDEGRILLVRRNYGPRNWTTPGGRLEAGESPLTALVREVREETGYQVEPETLVGVYAAPFRDDILLLLRARVLGRGAWRPDGEIAEAAFFARDGLPQPMHERTLARVADAFEGRSGVLRVFAPEESGPTL